jgi:hypothetical protein
MGNIIAFLSLLVAILVSWNQLMKTFKDLGGTLNKVPLLIFEMTAISLSGIFVAGILWMIYDYLAVGSLSLNVALLDLANGAVWGLPIALLTAILSRTTERAIIISVLISFALLMFYRPENVIANPATSLTIRQIYAIALLLWIVLMGIVNGYVGLKVKTFIEGNWAGELKSDSADKSLRRE